MSETRILQQKQKAAAALRPGSSPVLAKVQRKLREQYMRAQIVYHKMKDLTSPIPNPNPIPIPVQRVGGPRSPLAVRPTRAGPIPYVP